MTDFEKALLDDLLELKFAILNLSEEVRRIAACQEYHKNTVETQLKQNEANIQKLLMGSLSPNQGN